jgi:purine-binding chemotaxis protein CheW
MRPFIQFSSRNIQKSAEYYLAFSVDDDKFAANFPKIAGFSKEFELLTIENSADFIAGVAKVNSEFIPIVDLKRKIGMNKPIVHNSGKLIIVETVLFDIHLKFAISYDQLGDAFEIPEKKMMPVPNIGIHFESGYVKGVHVHENECILILDVENLFTIDDLIDLKVTQNRFIKKAQG